MTDDVEALQAAVLALWMWATAQGLERHAEDGDLIAQAILILAQRTKVNHA